MIQEFLQLIGRLRNSKSIVCGSAKGKVATAGSYRKLHAVAKLALAS